MTHPSTAEKLAALKVTEPSDYEKTCMDLVGAGDYEIGVQRTADIVDEGYEVFMRSCRSEMGVAGDSIVAIFNAKGDLVNASAGTYLHVIIPPIVIKFILKHYSENPGIEDGDIWYTNDALYGGIHNPDQVAIMPVFYNGELVAWTAALSHTTETGAIEPGGMPLTGSARYDEGMNLPPTKIGQNHVLRNDAIELFSAFGLRAEQMVIVDLRARCTTTDRVRVRLLEMFEREGRDYVTGLFRKMLTEAEQGARKRLAGWPDGVYRCRTFSDAAGLEKGLLRNCCMTMTKRGDSLLVDFTGTSPETKSSYNAHTQAAVGHLANYIYEYVFHDLPISSATFQPVDFIFPQNSMLSPAADAATSNSVMASSGAMSSIANCISRARFGTSEWRQVAASLGNGGNASVLAGLSQWGMPIADMLAYTINTEGSGARAQDDGINAYGFPWCAFGRAPDVENMENEMPMLVPFSQHREDSAGAGKYRGGVGTAQLWVTHHAPTVFYMAISDNASVQTPQPLFGAYTMGTIPGVTVEDLDILELMRAGDEGRLDLKSLLEGKYGGRIVSEPYGRATRAVSASNVITVGLSTGGSGLGDPIDRDPDAVENDVTQQYISTWSARNVYSVAIDEHTGRVDEERTRQLRQNVRDERIARGRPYDEFVKEWEQRKPDPAILKLYGSWPDAEVIEPVVRI